jgi:glutamate carboxypeptidase
MMLELVLDEDAGSEARYDLALAAHRPGVERTDDVVQLFEFVKSVGHEFGIDIEETGSSAAGSSAFAAEAGCIVLDGMGPAGGDLMTKDEYIEVDSIVERSGVLAMAISRLAVDPPRR